MTARYFDGDEAGWLRDAVDDLVGDWAGVEATTMFGCPSYRVDGALFLVLVTEWLALTRLPEERREEIEAAFETGPFRAGDRTVTKWVQVAVDDRETVEELEPFVRASYDGAREETET